MFKKLPIGIQSFEKLREDNFLYVDKTALIYELVHNNTPYFLSRPRRFGKKSASINDESILGRKERAFFRLSYRKA